jgi:hypothetical protein
MSDLVQGKVLVNDDGSEYKIETVTDSVVRRSGPETNWNPLVGDWWSFLFEDEIFYDEDQPNHDS